MRDFKRLRQDPPQGVNGSPNPDNIMLWNAVIFGPEDTPWDGGTYVLSCGRCCTFAGLLMHVPSTLNPRCSESAIVAGRARPRMHALVFLEEDARACMCLLTHWQLAAEGARSTAFHILARTPACPLLPYTPHTSSHSHTLHTTNPHHHTTTPRHLQADAGVFRGLPQQGASGKVQVNHVPPQQ